MIVKILLSAGFVLVFALLFAISGALVGRNDKIHHCGMDDCASCTLRKNANNGAECPEKKADN